MKWKYCILYKEGGGKTSHASCTINLCFLPFDGEITTSPQNPHPSVSFSATIPTPIYKTSQTVHTQVGLGRTLSWETGSLVRCSQLTHWKCVVVWSCGLAHCRLWHPKISRTGDDPCFGPAVSCPQGKRSCGLLSVPDSGQHNLFCLLEAPWGRDPLPLVYERNRKETREI